MYLPKKMNLRKKNLNLSEKKHASQYSNMIVYVFVKCHIVVIKGFIK